MAKDADYSPEELVELEDLAELERLEEVVFHLAWFHNSLIEESHDERHGLWAVTLMHDDSRPPRGTPRDGAWTGSGSTRLGAYRDLLSKPLTPEDGERPDGAADSG